MTPLTSHLDQQAQTLENFGTKVKRPHGASLRLHLLDTRQTGVANAVAAIRAGVTTFDASLGGAGGCPFAPAATGNVASEDLVYLFDRMGQPTGLDLAELTSAVSWRERRLGAQLPGALLRADGFPA